MPYSELRPRLGLFVVRSRLECGTPCCGEAVPGGVESGSGVAAGHRDAVHDVVQAGPFANHSAQGVQTLRDELFRSTALLKPDARVRPIRPRPTTPTARCLPMATSIADLWARCGPGGLSPRPRIPPGSATLVGGSNAGSFSASCGEAGLTPVSAPPRKRSAAPSTMRACRTAGLRPPRAPTPAPRPSRPAGTRSPGG